MPVAALCRFKKVPSVGPALVELIHESDVGLHAMSPRAGRSAQPYIEQVEQTNRGTQLGEQAERELKKTRKALA